MPPRAQGGPRKGKDAFRNGVLETISRGFLHYARYDISISKHISNFRSKQHQYIETYFEQYFERNYRNGVLSETTETENGRHGRASAIDIHTYIYIHICMYIYIYIYTYTYVYITYSICVHIERVCIIIYIYIYVYIYIYCHAYVYIYIYINKHKKKHKLIYIYIYVYMQRQDGKTASRKTTETCATTINHANICIYIYIWEKGTLWRPHVWHMLCWNIAFRLGNSYVEIYSYAVATPCLAYVMLKYTVMLCYSGETPLLNTTVSPRPYILLCFQINALFRYGETTLLACTCQPEKING